MSMTFFEREPEVQELRAGETGEKAAMMLSSLPVVEERRGRTHLSRSHAGWVGPVRQRNQPLDGAIRRQ
jgi:hypothetical protein